MHRPQTLSTYTRHEPAELVLHDAVTAGDDFLLPIHVHRQGVFLIVSRSPLMSHHHVLCAVHIPYLQVVALFYPSPPGGALLQCKPRQQWRLGVGSNRPACTAPCTRMLTVPYSGEAHTQGSRMPI
jgi:hypothetical protein